MAKLCHGVGYFSSCFYTSKLLMYFYLSIVLNLVISFLPLHPSREEGVRHLYVFLRILNKKKIRVITSGTALNRIFFLTNVYDLR